MNSDDSKKSSEEKTTVGYGDVHQFSDDNHQNLIQCQLIK